jgi:spore germination protein GerM
MFFPDSLQSRMAGETRYVPRRKSREDMIQKYLQELILGPERIDFLRLFPRNTELHSVILRDSTLYIDFNENILFQDSDTPLNFNETIEMLKSALFYNFHYLKKINVTANGQVPIKKNKSR